MLKANKIIKEKDKIIEELKENISKKKEKLTENNQVITKLESDIKNNIIELKRLKIDLNVKIEENKDNKLIKVKFISSDGIINTTIQSFENDKFNVVEEKLYVEFDKYRDNNNIYLVHGNQVLRFKSLKENKIKDGDVVTLTVLD